jgi:wobble nucleotide-excising tRNase
MSCIVTDAGDTFLSHSFIGRAIVVIEGIIIIMHRRGGEEEKERCGNFGKMIRRDEQPCPYCHKEGFALTKIVDESEGIKEITVVVLDRLERDLR